VRTAPLSAALAVVAVASNVLADPPPPKVCVLVAGDADPNVQAAASTLSEAIAARADLRGVVDADTRAVLRGEGRDEPSLADYVAARRALSGTEADARTLDEVGQRLGCALAVDVMARPSGLRVRAYDVVHRSMRPAVEVATLTPPLVDEYVLPHARAAMEPISDSASRPAGTARADQPAQAAAAPARAPRDPRTALQPEPARRVGLPPTWAWAVAGGAALLLVGGFFLVQSSGPGTPVITVMHPPTGGAP
jgi:hypothetical protein